MCDNKLTIEGNKYKIADLSDLKHRLGARLEISFNARNCVHFVHQFLQFRTTVVNVLTRERRQQSRVSRVHDVCPGQLKMQKRGFRIFTKIKLRMQESHVFFFFCANYTL